MPRRAVETIRVTLEERAIAAVRDEILSGRFEPGERLTEWGLSDLLGFSRGTVRSALQQLGRDGLVTLSSYRGWAVQSLTSRDAWELYTLRNTLESFGARLLADAINDEKCLRIDAAFEMLNEAVASENRHKIVGADFNLHQVLIALTGHERLRQHYDVIRQQMMMFLTFGSAFLKTKEYIDYHLPLIEAIKSGNAVRAERLAANHNTNDGEALVAKLKGIEEAAAEKEK